MSGVPGVRRFRLPKPAITATLVASGLLTLLALVVFSIHNTGDYNVAAPVGGDNTGPGLMALVHGNLDRYADLQPVVGLTSILLRLPFVAVAQALHAGALLTYQVGAMVCLVPLVVLGAWLVAAPGLNRRDRLVRLIAMLLVVQSPILRNEIAVGHPEGQLAMVLGVFAVLAASRSRAVWAGVLLGLSIAAKESGLVALLPVMIALPDRRREAALATVGVVILLCCSQWVADPSGLMRAIHGEGATHYLTPLSVLWPFSSPVHVGTHISVASTIPFGLTRTRATLLVGALVAAAGLVWFSRCERRGVVWNPLALLALLGVMRCVCDSTHELYYWASVLIPVAAWEATENRVPIATLMVTVTIPALYSSPSYAPPMLVYIGANAVEIGLVSYLARRSVQDAHARAATRRLGTSETAAAVAR